MNIVILGSGVVGQATGKEFLRRGFPVEFRDTDRQVLEKLRTAGYTAKDLTSVFDSDIDVFFVCVPTPTRKGEPDLDAIQSVLQVVGTALVSQKNFPVVVMRSTVPVGTAKDMAAPLLEKISGKKAGVQFGVCSNPEYLRELEAEIDFKNPRIVIIGVDDPTSESILKEVYREFKPVTHLLTSREAEMHKYVHNLFNASKISYFNEQRAVCRELGISAEVIFPLVAISAEASWNPQYGIKDFGPFGGACLLKDVRGFLGWAKKQTKMCLPFMEAVLEVNDKTPEKKSA